MNQYLDDIFKKYLGEISMVNEILKFVASFCLFGFGKKSAQKKIVEKLNKRGIVDETNDANFNVHFGNFNILDADLPDEVKDNLPDDVKSLLNIFDNEHVCKFNFISEKSVNIGMIVGYSTQFIPGKFTGEVYGTLPMNNYGKMKNNSMVMGISKENFSKNKYLVLIWYYNVDENFSLATMSKYPQGGIVTLDMTQVFLGLSK